MTARVLHLNWIPEPCRWPGVMAKLAQQARAAVGSPLEFVVLTAGESGNRDGLRLVPIACDGFSGRFKRHRLIAGALPLADFAAVVLRYHTGVDCDFSAWPKATVRLSEHHTIESAELADGSLRGWAQAGLERWRGPRYLRAMRGVIAVTDEILRHQLARAPGLPGLVLGNGIEIGGIPAASPPAWDGGELHLVFASGRFDVWQGLDRLIAGLATHRGPPVVLHLVGQRVPLASRLDATSKIIHHGVLEGAALDRVMASAHLAIGPLAVHRKGLREACPLKSRDAIARGIPLVFAHGDPDLPDGHPGWLRLPADESPIPIDALVGFASACATRQPGLSHELRGFAAVELSWQPRLRRLAEFALEVAGG